MRFRALATDFDGTLAEEGRVSEAALAALAALRKSDRFLLLVTGRLLEDIQNVFSRLDLFDWVVAENGAVLYEPASRQRVTLAAPPPKEFLDRLTALGVPLEWGHVIVATREPHEKAVLDVIRDLGLELQVIFNKGAVMVLPTNVNKASGLSAALHRMKLSPHNTVAVGDAENDHAFLSLCECAVATANALPSLKQHANVVLEEPNGEGVARLADEVRLTDLAGRPLPQHDVPLGTTREGTEVFLHSYLSGTLLFAGPSGGGKSTAALSFVERIEGRGYQICIIDPEGDYEAFGKAIVLGDATTATSVDEVTSILLEPDRSVIVNLLAVQAANRPAFADELLSRLFGIRARYGRPHWIVLDEAHHIFPVERSADAILPRDLNNVLVITTEPKLLAKELLATVRTAIGFGNDAAGVIREAVPIELPASSPAIEAQAVIWRSDKAGVEMLADVYPPASKKQRHRRKYAVGALAPEKSFFFQGPDGKLNLRANNLTLFAQIAEGVDDATWFYHLQRGDYERWFRESIGDGDLALAAKNAACQPVSSRKAILSAIHDRYTAPG
ncbi:MAG: HAD-IIB family hydrolase [Candidatus Eremiobacteraeota bacterium]|nr:HAD-IIB family hydrolase [Candidatus Eremiobacteraeota bacterium]